MSGGDNEKILLAHGGGGRLSEQLIRETIVPVFDNQVLSELGDSAELEAGLSRVCFTTDSYVVKPLFFNGGDIGKLAVCGTVNDLAVCGARPLGLSMGLILEEGFEKALLERILCSAAEAGRQAGVQVVTGDTKVVEKGAADSIFINTAGVGLKKDGVELGKSKVSAGDKIIVSGDIGDHGMTIISQREGIKFESPLSSDCACLNGLIDDVLGEVGGVKFMRDPTRGGLSATVNEIAKGCGCDILLYEKLIPINTTTRAAADMLGFDLLEIANEGKVVFAVRPKDAEKVVEVCRKNELGKNASIIGEVIERKDVGAEPIVEIVTEIGGRRIVQMPYGRELPRIC